MRKQSILNKINEIIVEEKGTAISIDSKFLDANLDSLSVIVVLVALDDEYQILKDVPNGEETNGLEDLTIRDIINKVLTLQQ